jgi:Flp pilus assembly protein TadG
MAVRHWFTSERIRPERSLPKRNRRSLFSSEEGSQLVEFALVLPIMLMVMLAIAVISVTMNNYLQVTEATSNAARAVSIARSNTLDPCSTVFTAVSQGAPTLTSANLTVTLALNSKDGANLGTYGPTAGSLTCSSGSYSSGAPSYLQQGGSATVTVTYPCSLSIFGVNYAPGCTLRASMTEMVQ